jgi:hypothetical protein
MLEVTEKNLTEFLTTNFSPETRELILVMVATGSASYLPNENGLPDVQRLAQVKCRSCVGFIPNNFRPGAYQGATSRRGLGEICSTCGTNEALDDYAKAIDRVLGVEKGEGNSE